MTVTPILQNEPVKPWFDDRYKRPRPEDFLYLAARTRQLAAFLGRPDAQAIVDADPELDVLLVRLQTVSDGLNETFRFIGHGRRHAAKYGLTEDQFWQIVLDQNLGCAICDTEFGPGRTMNIDHNHDTGGVRGVLCPNCNTGLGRFKDSPDLLDRALKYLDEKGHYGPAIEDGVA